MKSVKFILPTTLLALLMISPVLAQNRFNPQDMAKRQSQYIISNISTLNAAQKDSVQAIFTEFANQMQTAFQNNSGDRQARRDQMMKMVSKRDDRIKALFTADQFKQYQDLMQKMRNSRRRN